MLALRGLETMILRRLFSIQSMAIVASALLYAASAAAESAHVRVAGTVQTQPVTTAPASGTIKAGVAVDIVTRKGFWAQIRGGGVTGWLKLTRLSLDSNSGNQVAALASGRTGSNNVVSASGGRGLDATDLENATPNTAAVAALASTAASEAAADQFAKAGKLKTRSLSYLSGSR